MGLDESIAAYRDRFDCHRALRELDGDATPRGRKARARYLLHALRLRESMDAVEAAHRWADGGGYTLALLTTQVEAAVLLGDAADILYDAKRRTLEADPHTAGERELKRYLLAWIDLFCLGWEDAYVAAWELLGDGSTVSPAKSATYRLGLAVAADRLGERRTAVGALRAAEFAWRSLDWTVDRALIAARTVAACDAMGRDGDAETWRRTVAVLPVPEYARRDLHRYAHLLAEAFRRQIDLDLA